MRIVHVVPGSGNTFYCENCLRDTALVKAQRALGHTVIMAPMYLPMFADEPGIAGDSPVFYGAISTYLAQEVPLLGRLPAWLLDTLNAPALLKWAARKAGTTRAGDLDEMTISMLRGAEGRQARELERLIAWMITQAKPDVVHLSNALLLGLARRIRRDVGVPVVCSLQDEDTWIDAMSPKGARRAWDTMIGRAEDVALFTPVSEYYAGVMRERLRLPAGRMRTVYVGIDLEGHQPSPLRFDPPVIGYLSRMTESLGLGTLVEAFITLKQSPRLKDLRLRATGGEIGDDARFIARLRKRLASLGMENDAAFLPAFDRPARLAFLQTISVMSVPMPRGEAFGMFQLEAMASGVPVVQPRAGAFPEIIGATGGGVVYEPNTVDGLAHALSSVLLDEENARALGSAGRKAVFNSFSIERTARELVSLYQALIH